MKRSIVILSRGGGLGTKIVYDRVPPKSDPLGPDNLLGFVTGPLTKTGIPGGGRYTVVTKSPVTGGCADANSGGFWGPELKNAIVKTYTQLIKNNPFHQGLFAAGTGGGTSFLLSIGNCPTRNWSTTGTDSMPTGEKLDSAKMDINKKKIRLSHLYGSLQRHH